MTPSLASALGMIAFPLGVGLFMLCWSLGDAATTNARARLLEAENARRTLDARAEGGGDRV